MLTIYCPKCYTANRETDRMCSVCGASLTQEAGKDYTEKLIWALHHPEPTVAPRAAWILGERRDSRAVEPLIALIRQSRDIGALEEATVALGKLGDARAVPALETLLKESYGSVRERAAWALGMIGDSRAVPTLCQALSDTSRIVRLTAQVALESIQSLKPQTL